MRIAKLRSALAGAALASVFAAAASAQDAGKNAAPPDFQAKVQYCKTCHGLSGQGFHGAIPIPRLAGQQGEYFENQLGAFLELRREDQECGCPRDVVVAATRLRLRKLSATIGPNPAFTA